MSRLSTEKAVFERELPGLQKAHPGSNWVLVYGDEIRLVSPSFEEVAELAIQEFGKGPYLIRQIQREPLRLSTSIMTYGDQRASTA
jgi:hypothetical protein